MYVTFETFIENNGAQLRAGLVAAFGPNIGVEAAADAMAYGWENWDRLKKMKNPTGYLYRVGQTSVRRQTKPQGYLPAKPVNDGPSFEPQLAPSLEGLTESQRVAVVLVHALGWPLGEAAVVLDISVSSLRAHIQRGLEKLRVALKVDAHDI